MKDPANDAVLRVLFEQNAPCPQSRAITQRPREEESLHEAVEAPREESYDEMLKFGDIQTDGRELR